MAHEQNARLHLCHLSLPRSVDLVQWYRNQGLDVTLETCPHYLTFTEDDYDAQGGRLKINPPLRKESDRDGMWERLASGSVDVVSSDHAPWPTEYKDHEGIFANHSGAPGVQTSRAVTLPGALRRGQDGFNAAARILTEAHPRYASASAPARVASPPAMMLTLLFSTLHPDGTSTPLRCTLTRAGPRTRV